MNNYSVALLTPSVLAILLLIATGYAVPATAYNPVRDLTGKTIHQHVEHKTEKLAVATDKFLHNPVEYLTELPASLVADVCSAPIQQYEGTLRGQANGRWKGLPQDLVIGIQDAYSVNLASVRYAENIDTIGSNAYTFGKSIYFPRRINLQDRQDLRWMLHELEHTVQFAGATYGRAGKLCEYAAHAFGNAGNHDEINMEEAAERKADWVIDYAYWVMTNGVPEELATDSQIARNEIVIINHLDIPVEFEMATEYTAKGTETIPPYTSRIFTGHANDTWFNLDMGSADRFGRIQWVSYGLDGGTTQHIQRRDDGALDFFYE